MSWIHSCTSTRKIPELFLKTIIGQLVTEKALGVLSPRQNIIRATMIGLFWKLFFYFNPFGHLVPSIILKKAW